MTGSCAHTAFLTKIKQEVALLVHESTHFTNYIINQQKHDVLLIHPDVFCIILKQIKAAFTLIYSVVCVFFNNHAS